MPDAGHDAGPPGCQGPPGLFVEGSCSYPDTLAPGVRPYHPRFLLWADGAEKERAIYLPPDTQIDTSNPDHWVFPRGTRLYKTFVLDGVRLETRILEKTDAGTGPTVWTMRAFAWNDAQDEVTEVSNASDSELQDVLGTDHDIPSVRNGECLDCHAASLDTVNGFSAIELNHDEDGLTLQMLNDEHLLTEPVLPADATIPGDAATVAALGYLHANCGGCHRAQPGGLCPAGGRGQAACATGLHMWVNVGTDTVEETDTWSTAVGLGGYFYMGQALCRIHPGDPDSSALAVRMAHRGDAVMMPPIATEMTDTAGINTIRTWIAGLPPPAGTDDCPSLP